MYRRKPTIENFIDAIIARDSGMPYPTVIETFGITPNGFCDAVQYKLRGFIEFVDDKKRTTLEGILRDSARCRELFNMGEEFLRKQYDRIYGMIKGETQGTFYKGTLIHPENIQAIVYYVLTLHNPQLASANRAEVIQAIKSLPFNLRDYFYSLGLIGLMSNFEKGKRNSPLAVLEIFDQAYQKRTGDASLFDLTQKDHLHKWGDKFIAPNAYWKNPYNVEEAVYHTLTEHNPQLTSKDRAEVIKAIKGLPIKLKYYFIEVGLRGLMLSAFKNQDSPLLVLKVFDRVYQRITGDVSLFNKSKSPYLEYDSKNRLIR